MLLYLVLAVTLIQYRVTASSEDGNVTSTVDEDGRCLCTVVLPDNTFPLHRMESLEYTAYHLNISVHQEITKIQSFQGTLNLYLQRLKNLTHRVQVMETGGISFSELDFELVKLEIKEMESLVVQLRASMTGTNVMVETLYAEIRNISIMVNQLESYDKNNVLAVRREIVALRKRLQDCEKDQSKDTSSPPSYAGTCDHGGLKNVSKPFVVQLNWKGFGYRYGGWGKDSFLGTSKGDMYWVAPLRTDARMMDSYRLHPSYDDLLLYRNPTDRALNRLISNTHNYDNCGQGSGMIVYNNSLYYNCYNSRNLCKLNLDTSVIERKSLDNAVFNGRFSYAAAAYQDINFAADENGLWVFYSTEESAGNIIIGKVNAALMVEQSWTTSQYKPGVTNAFMICGVMYATRPVNTRREEIFYMYDTKTGQEGKLSIMMDKMMETIQSLSYNPNDHKLYMYNDGYQVTYDATFTPAAALS